MITTAVDARLRLELQVWRLIPKDRNTSANLHKRHFLAVVFDDLLRFDEIRDVPFFVNAAAEKTRSGSFRGATGDENPREIVTVNRNLIDRND